ncbi:hypothetical protein BVC80_1819g104 [Macleaya cordata]|uniref:Uncharacterized protein n=1 Tax=Macleaya cordata TaxID=56857 RepID=A0A200QWD2_MACCD|nr:hypothetical protein BVC80_1819g104 [Macleaya cordata]
MSFKVTDDKSILAQAHNFLNIISDLKVAEITLPVEFLVGVIIACLPKLCNGYMKKLKHDEKKYTLESLLYHLRIEKDSRKREEKSEDLSKANVVEDNKSKHTSLKPKNDNKFKKDSKNKNKNKKNTGDCYYL